MAFAKYGTPEWKPISETWHASITVIYRVQCHNCGGGIYQDATTPQEAVALATKHDATHDKNLAGCCMYATGVVCDCGNVLV